MRDAVIFIDSKVLRGATRLPFVEFVEESAVLLNGER